MLLVQLEGVWGNHVTVISSPRVPHEVVSTTYMFPFNSLNITSLVRPDPVRQTTLNDP